MGSVPGSPGGNPPPRGVMDNDPVVQLVYELMRRGSVLPQTMQQVVALVSARAVKMDDDRLGLAAVAVNLCGQLPWYSGSA